ncbi:MAG: ATP-binding protein [Candidatus Micrarchaeia archaeon]
MEVKILDILDAIKVKTTDSIPDNELLMRIGESLKKLLNADDFESKDIYINVNDRTQTDDFLINTGKPYVDDNLSGYSAFSELINYKNKGYKSCLLIPIFTKTIQFGILTFLSKKENAFEQKSLQAYTLISERVGELYEKRVENKKNQILSRYFDSAFESITPQVIINNEGKILRYNKKFNDLLERNMGDILNLSIDNIFAFPEKFEPSKKDQSSIKLINSKRVFDFYVNKIDDSTYHIAFNDVTGDIENKAIESVIDSSKNQLYFLLDQKLNILNVYGGLEDYNNLQKEYFIGRPFITFFKDKELQKELDKLENTKLLDSFIKVGELYSSDVKIFIFKNKEISAAIVWKNNEKYANILKKTLNDIISFSGDMIITTDSMGYIKEANESFEKITGYNINSINGISISSICPDNESQRRINTALDIVKKGGVLNGMEIGIVSKIDGEILPSSQTVKPIFEVDGKVKGYIFIGRELITKKKLKESLELLNELNKKAEKLQYESQLKTQFIYNISHDLKTPITNIMGFSKLMLGEEFGQLNEEQKRTLGIIINEGNRLLQLISQILDVAKLESKKIKLDIKPVDFNDIKESPIIKSLEGVATNKGITLSFTVDPETYKVESDPNRLIQVFVNLIDNALKFTEKGGVTVSVKNHGSKKNPMVKVEVNDTGIGINKEYKSKLFKKFFQVKKETSTLTRPEGTGTGLGLSIAKEIVSLHGGRIGVNSESGKGSTFWFVLPVSQKQKRKIEQDHEQSNKN